MARAARSHRLTHHGWRGSEASPDHAGLSPRAPGVLVVLGFRGLVGRGRARPGGILTESHRILRELFPSGVDRPQSGPGCDRGRVGGLRVHLAAVGLLRGSHPARRLRLAGSRRPWRPAPRTRSEATVLIPPLPLGNYYLIARVNASGSLAETNTANNDVATPFRIAPHVDLSPIDLTAPASATTQQSISVSWTVDNFVSPLPEDATADLWQDNLYISAESDVLRGRHLSRELVPRGRTETQRSVYPDADRHRARSPGGGLLRHRADRRHGRPGGDRRGQCDLHSDPGHDAGPRAHVAPRSRRVGGGVGPAGHLGILDGVEPGDGADARVLAGQPVHLAEPHVLRGRDARWGHGRRRPPSSPHASYQQTRSITVPTLAAGSYYLIVWTNATGSLHEEDDDNSRLAIPLTITTSDLVPTALSAPASAVTGQGITVSWTVKNAGTGPTVGTWADTLHLSPTPTCCAGATLLGRWERTALAAGASLYADEGPHGAQPGRGRLSPHPPDRRRRHGLRSQRGEQRAGDSGGHHDAGPRADRARRAGRGDDPAGHHRVVDGEESGDGRDGQDVDGQPVPCADVELLRRSDPAGPVDLADVGRGRGNVHADEERDPARRSRGRLSAHPSGRCGDRAPRDAGRQ